MNKFKSIKALVFDLDDTLIHSTAAYEEAIESICPGKRNLKYHAARLAVKYRVGPHHVSSHNRVLYLKEMLTREKNFSPAHVLDLLEKYESALVQSIRHQWKRLNREFLLKKLSRHYTLAILSNENTRTQLLKLCVIDPSAKYFKTILTSEELGVEKPDRRMFMTMARLLGIPPRHCLMIGDNPAVDIKPALRLGFKAILTCEFTNPKPPAPIFKFPVIDHLDQLIPLLKI